MYIHGHDIFTAVNMAKYEILTPRDDHINPYTSSGHKQGEDLSPATANIIQQKVDAQFGGHLNHGIQEVGKEEVQSKVGDVQADPIIGEGYAKPVRSQRHCPRDCVTPGISEVAADGNIEGSREWENVIAMWLHRAGYVAG
ncbi:hypothetical protein GDO81_028854 [Engystomops pustulosus]|uniref:Uncharacterized protein n=1 Tax=Engystomops pustulosus TaxID=76066 RepID=A0AAV6YK28_ENGPU|nr:hypothetical protein GDO81_028854 [Engystomops pustulosus]